MMYNNHSVSVLLTSILIILARVYKPIGLLQMCILLLLSQCSVETAGCGPACLNPCGYCTDNTGRWSFCWQLWQLGPHCILPACLKNLMQSQLEASKGKRRVASNRVASCPVLIVWCMIWTHQTSGWSSDGRSTDGSVGWRKPVAFLRTKLR